MSAIQIVELSTQEPAAPELLAARNVGKRADDGKRWLVRGVDWVVRAGQRWALQGVSGTGKSVLLQMLAGLLACDEGDLQWRGRPIAAAEMPMFRADVMYLSQRPTVFEGTMEENLQLPFQLNVHRRRTYDRQRTLRWLRQLRRDGDLLTRRDDQVSGGESQTIALLRALQLDPTLLLLDEPTAALDAGTAEALEEFIVAWQAERPQQHAYVWVTHDAGQAQRVANNRMQLTPDEAARGHQPI